MRKFTLMILFCVLFSFFFCILFQPGRDDFLMMLTKRGGQERQGFSKFLQYVENNGIKVPFQMFVLSLIPIPFAYCLPVCLTAILCGFVFYVPMMPFMAGKISFLQIVAGMLPHSVLEFMGYIILLSALYPINRWILQKIVFRRNEPSFFKQIKNSVLAFCIAFIFICLAAFIEAFLTPILYSSI